jgi:D-inositol-3-phosphate glycosyltransferase
MCDQACSLSTCINPYVPSSEFDGAYARQVAPDNRTKTHLRCVAVLDQPPGAQYQNVRTPPTGFIGRLNRLQERLMRKVRPEIEVSSYVRGARVAIDYLLDAFLEYTRSITFSFVVSDVRHKDFEQWAVTRRDSARRTVELFPATRLGRGFQECAPDIWLNLHGDMDFALRVRDQLSDRMYPTVTVQHGLSAHFLLYSRYLRALLTPSYACDSIICTTNACRRAVANLLQDIARAFCDQTGIKPEFRGRLDTIPLCVDTDSLLPHDKSLLRKQLGIPQDAVVLMYIGYLSQAKADLSPLLTVFKQLVNDNHSSNLRLIVVGTGPEAYAKALQTVVEELKLTKVVAFYREVTDATKTQLLASADIFVAPCESMQESFGLTPVEAMSCGVPQVVADWSGYRETVINGQTGFLIPTCWGRCDTDLRFTGDLLGWHYDHIVQGQSIAFDMKIMYERLNALIRSPELRIVMSKHSRARATTEFSYLAITRRYEALWAELLDAARSERLGPKRRHFDQPRYFDHFGHFATSELTDDCLIRQSEAGLLPIKTVVEMANAECPGVGMFDERLSNRLTQILSNSGRSGVLTVGEITALAADDWRSPEIIRRHILFLLKHGKAVLQQTGVVTTNSC